MIVCYIAYHKNLCLDAYSQCALVKWWTLNKFLNTFNETNSISLYCNLYCNV